MAGLIGSQQGLGFDFDWVAPTTLVPSSADLTRGYLRSWVGGRLVWGYERSTRVRGFLWTWIELLEHLARVWPYISWEERYPLGLSPSSPADIMTLAKQRLANVSDPRRSELDRAIWDFAEAHDLASGVNGMTLPSLWIVAVGNIAQIASGDAMVELGKADALNTLAGLADAIAARLHGSKDARGLAAVRDWEARDVVDRERLLEIYSGFAAQELRTLGENLPLWKAWEVPSNKPFKPTELLAVARGIRGLVPPESMLRLLSVIRAIPSSKTDELDELSKIAADVLSTCADEKPAEQGLRVALAIREELDLSDAPLSPTTLLRRLGVPIKQSDFGTSHVDAVAVWGPNHGPAVILNSKGLHARGEAGRNATLAHELCHLLVDRAAALPLAEVLEGQVALPVEARARAFAAELLMPRSAVADAFARGASPKAIVQRLCKKYGVSSEMVAWQARNSETMLSPAAFAFLRGQVSRPTLF